MSDPIAVSRRLVAVFAADVEGYSHLMGTDEVGTLKGLTERRAILDRLIADHTRHHPMKPRCCWNEPKRLAGSRGGTATSG
jgi:hypothetical protein